MHEDRLKNASRPMATALRLSLEHLEANDSTATALLHLCSFLAPDDLPIGIVEAGAHELPEELQRELGGGVGFDRVLSVLRRFSLVERYGDRYRVHRLVQSAVRDALDPDEWESCLAVAIRVLLAGFPEDVENRAQQWDLCSRLLPHAVAVERLATQRMVEPRALGWLLHGAGNYLRTRGEFGLARTFSQRALTIRESTLGTDHPDIAEGLNDLAVLVWAQGDLAEARPLLERAVSTSERALGSDHPTTAVSLSNLAVLLVNSGDLSGARVRFQHALAIKERALGQDHPSIAIGLSQLARVLVKQGEGTAALPLFERALAIRESKLGPDHPDTANSLHDLACLLAEQGDLDAARPLQERALSLREARFGPDHPDTAWSQHHVAALYRQRGELATARLLSARAVATLECVLGTAHPRTVASRKLLAEIVAEVRHDRRRSEPDVGGR
jgi:tetratricopeptide (TPR) repeat protein